MRLWLQLTRNASLLALLVSILNTTWAHEDSSLQVKSDKGVRFKENLTSDTDGKTGHRGHQNQRNRTMTMPTGQRHHRRNKSNSPIDGNALVSWPHPLLPINYERWKIIQSILAMVPEPSYDSLLQATLNHFCTGKRRLHRQLVKLSNGEREGSQMLETEVWWSDEEDEVRISAYHEWSSEMVQNWSGRSAQKYRFRWKRGVGNSWLAWLLGSPEHDKYATVIIRGDNIETKHALRLPTDGKFWGELEWQEYLVQFDVDDHYTPWPSIS